MERTRVMVELKSVAAVKAQILTSGQRVKTMNVHSTLNNQWRAQQVVMHVCLRLQESKEPNIVCQIKFHLSLVSQDHRNSKVLISLCRPESAFPLPPHL